MKIILSRKGFDAANGGMANPILPDGTLLSFPIPTDDVENTYNSLQFNGSSYFDILKSLKPRTKIQEHEHCHLDPDLRADVRPRPLGWKPAFGQMDAALTELRNHQIGVGDLFLFFGWFKETEFRNGKLTYKKGAPDWHVIYGYLQVGSIIENRADAPIWLDKHPHIAYTKSWEAHKNAIFLPADKLSISENLSGAGTLQFDKKLVLTKDGCSRSRWALPNSFRQISIGHNPKGWKADFFQSAGIGQEFIIDDVNEDVIKWVKMLLA